MTAFERMGGEPVVRSIVDQFVDRVFDDTMIGFLFRKSNRERVKKMEYEHAAVHLGADIEYSGRPLLSAHRPHRISGGQFERRSVILESTLRSSGVPEDIVESWLAYTRSLRPEITGDEPGQCLSEPLARNSTSRPTSGGSSKVGRS